MPFPAKRGLPQKPGGLADEGAWSGRWLLPVAAQQTTYSIPVVASTELLGTMVAREGDSHCAVAHRITQAWKAYAAERDLAIPRPERLRRYRDTVQQVLLWGAD